MFVWNHYTLGKLLSEKTFVWWSFPLHDNLCLLSHSSICFVPCLSCCPRSCIGFHQACIAIIVRFMQEFRLVVQFVFAALFPQFGLACCLVYINAGLLPYLCFVFLAHLFCIISNFYLLRPTFQSLCFRSLFVCALLNVHCLILSVVTWRVWTLFVPFSTRYLGLHLATTL